MADDYAAAIRTLQLVEETASHVTAADLHAVGKLAVTLIAVRTKKGLDADGKKFKPYSKNYYDYKTEKGETGAVSLVETKRMIGALDARVRNSAEIEIGFVNATEAEIASYHINGTKRLPTRDFFDVRKENELEAISEELADLIIERIHGL